MRVLAQRYGYVAMLNCFLCKSRAHASPIGDDLLSCSAVVESNSYIDRMPESSCWHQGRKVKARASPNRTETVRLAALKLFRCLLCTSLAASVITLSHDYSAIPGRVHEYGMEAHPALAHAGTGAALADSDALQLGATGRHDAFFSGSCQKKSSALPGSSGRGRGDSGTAWLPAVV